MLFNSYIFILVFLPASLLIFHYLNLRSRAAAVAALVVLSLIYHGYWSYRYLPLLVISILFNYALALQIVACRAIGDLRRAKVWLVAGLAGNLALLAYFKYAIFFADTLGTLTGAHYDLGTIVLPLAISFYTFTQITYLVDAHRGEAMKGGFLDYCLFVTFFPHLIAGPILHHKEMMPQFTARSGQRFRMDDLSVGLMIFFMGLAKKVLIADEISRYASPVFSSAADGLAPDGYTAWLAALSYTFQIYFDFSGYSDMAVGTARMFGIRLPINFFSPYRATSIIDFWRCWHMTLSRLLRDYLYIPLGGNQHGIRRRYAHLLATMLLGGLWHGAGWTFVVWGGLHGFYLIVNHGWRHLKSRWGLPADAGFVARFGARLLTLLAVMVGWVVFRAEDMSSALLILAAMFALGDAGWVSGDLSWLTFRPMFYCLVLLVFVWTAPNVYEIMRRHDPALMPERFKAPSSVRVMPAWQPTLTWAVALGLLAAGGLFAILSGRTEFLYYQF